ncbi:hypothetical protein DV38_02015 [Leptospira interrogans]|nr:hypothetical protein DV38_02015 [Leptospira interrogans]
MDELKRMVDLVALVKSYGIELKGHGKNLWHCMGTCQTGGSAIDFVMKKEGVRRSALSRVVFERGKQFDILFL